MAFVVTAKWTAKPGEEAVVADCIRKLIAPSRAEVGAIQYQVHREMGNERTFFFYEQYASEEAYRSHGESEHFVKWGRDIAIPRLEARERAFFETWDG